MNQNMGKQQYYENGRNYLENGNTDGAVLMFKKAIEQDHNYFEARYELALIYSRQNKHGNAERELLKVVRLNPSFHSARMELAKIYLIMDREDQAETILREVLDKDGKNKKAQDLLRSMRLKSGGR